MNRITITPLKRLLICMLVIIFLGLRGRAHAQLKEVPPNTKTLVGRFVAKDSSLLTSLFNTCNSREIETILSTEFSYYKEISTQTVDELIQTIQKNSGGKTGSRAANQLPRQLETVFVRRPPSTNPLSTQL